MKCRSVLSRICRGGGGQIQNSCVDVPFTAYYVIILSDNCLYVQSAGLSYSTQPTSDDVADSRTGTCIGALCFPAARTPVEDVTTRVLTDVNCLTNDRHATAHR